jgi:hypothetical protein
MAKSAPLMGPTAIIAFGTRGDVQPVALVAKLYALRGSTGGWLGSTIPFFEDLETHAAK